jgi:hypothetical protein
MDVERVVALQFIQPLSSRMGMTTSKLPITESETRHSSVSFKKM